MASITPLDRVVKLVENGYRPTYGKEKIVILNFKNGKILERKPVFSVGKDIRYYAVSTDRSVECEGLVCNIRDVETKHSLNIKIDYEISVFNGSQKKLVTAIYKRDNPKLAIEEFIEQCVKIFSRNKRAEGINLIKTFFEEKEALKKFIVDKTEADLGLEVHPFISLEGMVDILDPIKKTSENFPVRVKDYDENILIKYELGLEVIEGKDKINAVLNYNNLSKLHPIVKNEIEKFLIRDCTLHQLCFQFDSMVKPEIIKRIDLKLKLYGRQVSFIKFDLQIKDLLVPESPLITHATKCKIKDSPLPISVENRVLMNLQDLGKFRRIGIDSLEQWVQKKLDKIAQEVFFERERIDLLRSLEDDKKLIQENLQTESEKIGYRVKHLAFLPDLDELALMQGFKVEETASFRTRDNRIEMKIATVINAKVDNFNGIESHLKDGAEVFKKKIAQRSNDIIEQEIREKHPSEIYKSAFEGENSIDNVLKKDIISKLASNFNLVDLRVSLLFLDTNLSDRMRGLKAAFPSFVFAMIPDNVGQTLPYKVSYKITGVHKDGYDTFQNNLFKADKVEDELNVVNDYLMEGILKTLKDIPGEVLLNSSIQDLMRLEKEVILPVMKEIARKVFGLTLGEILVRRLETDALKASLELNKTYLELGMKTDIKTAKKKRQMLMERLEILDKQEKHFLKNEDPKGVKKIRKQIKKLTGKTEDYMDSYSNMQKAIGSSSKKEESKPLSLGEYLSQGKLTEGSEEKNSDDGPEDPEINIEN